MTEFENERAMPAGRDAVFAVVSDLDRLAEWLPDPIAVRPVDGADAPDGDDAGGDSVREVRELHAEIGSRGGGAGAGARGLARVRPAQWRMEWGGGHSGDYAGYLQVMGDDPDRSSVLLHLSFLGRQPETHGGTAAAHVREWLEEALVRLERLVAQAGPTS